MSPYGRRPLQMGHFQARIWQIQGSSRGGRQKQRKNKEKRKDTMKYWIPSENWQRTKRMLSFRFAKNSVNFAKENLPKWPQATHLARVSPYVCIYVFICFLYIYKMHISIQGSTTLQRTPDRFTARHLPVYCTTQSRGPTWLDDWGIGQRKWRNFGVVPCSHPLRPLCLFFVYWVWKQKGFFSLPGEDRDFF